MKHTHEEGLALEVAARIPDVIDHAARHDGHISLVALLRNEGIPYGVGQRIVDTLLSMRLAEPCGAPGFGWRLTGGGI